MTVSLSGCSYLLMFFVILQWRDPSWNTHWAWAVGAVGAVGPDSFPSEACEGALVPVTLGHVKDPGEFLIARFLAARIAGQKPVGRWKKRGG